MSRQRLWDGRKTYKDYCAGYRQKRDDHFKDNNAARKRAGKAKKRLFEPEKYEFKKKEYRIKEYRLKKKLTTEMQHSVSTTAIKQSTSSTSSLTTKLSTEVFIKLKDHFQLVLRKKLK